MLHRLLAVACILCFLIPDKIEAAGITFQKLEKSNVIFITGTINSGDDKKFKSIAANTEDATVILESNGGSTFAAVEIGKIIQIKSFNTAVFSGFRCDSACGLIWLAGTQRFLSRSAAVGFHASYTVDAGNQSQSGAGNALVGRYLTLLNLPERAVIFATLAPPGKLNYLNANNAAALGVEVSLLDDFNENSKKPSIDAPQQQSNEETRRWSKSGAWTVLVDTTTSNSCFMITTWEGGASLRIGLDVTNNLDGYFFLGNKEWSSIKDGEKYNLSLEFDSMGPWNVPTTGRKLGDQIYLYAEFAKKEFWNEFTSANAIKIVYEKNLINNLKMSGSKLAFDEMLNCQTYYVKLKKDPFRK